MHDKYESFLTPPLGPQPVGFVSDRGSETCWGGVVGIGGEYPLTRNRSLALEYDHLFMGSRDIALTHDPAFTAALNHNERIGQDRHGHRPHQLPLGWPGGRAVLMDSAGAEPLRASSELPQFSTRI
jgi:hypothetical protein